MDLTQEQFVYLDQNILVYIRDGVLQQSVFESLLTRKIRAVYSDETLKEISRAKETSGELLEVLRSIGAAHLTPCLDKNSQLSDSATVTLRDPFQAFENLHSGAPAMGLPGSGMQSIMYKHFGGDEDRTVREILNEEASELNKLIRRAFEGIDDNFSQTKVFRETLPLIEGIIERAGDSLADAYDSTEFNTVSDLDALKGLGPRNLNNIKGRQILLRVWERLSELSEPNAPDPEEAFLSAIAKTEASSKASLANCIYTYLNFVGYYRDKKMNDRARFSASHSDSIHAGLASYCSFLISGDGPMLRKTLAAFEYLGIGTDLIHFDPGSGKVEMFPPELNDRNS